MYMHILNSDEYDKQNYIEIARYLKLFWIWVQSEIFRVRKM